MVKKTLWILSISLMVLWGVNSAWASINLLDQASINPGFETADAGTPPYAANWDRGWASQQFRDTTVSHSGQASLMQTIQGGEVFTFPYGINASIWNQISPNIDYIVSGWIKTANVVDNGGWGGAELRLVTNTGAIEIGEAGTPWPRFAWIAGTNDWTYVSKLVSFSAPLTYMRLDCRLNAQSGTAWFDDLAITPVPEPVTMALLGLGSLALLRRRR